MASSVVLTHFWSSNCEHEKSGSSKLQPIFTEHKKDRLLLKHEIKTLIELKVAWDAF